MTESTQPDGQDDEPFDIFALITHEDDHRELFEPSTVNDICRDFLCTPAHIAVLRATQCFPKPDRVDDDGREIWHESMQKVVTALARADFAANESEIRGVFAQLIGQARK